MWKTFVPVEGRMGAAGKGNSQAHQQLLTKRIALGAGQTVAPLQSPCLVLLLVCTNSLRL